jgi:CRP/FNR family transcriptional regulator, cyclic AMP receptor protein
VNLWRLRAGGGRVLQRNATVKATSPMLLVTLTSWDIRRLRKSAPGAVDHLRGVVEQRRDEA